MWKKLAVVGSVVAVTGLGVGGVATAFSGAPAAQAAAPAVGVVPNAVAAPDAVGAVSNAVGAVVTAAASTDPTGKHAGKGKKHAGLAKRLARTSHASWVTKDKKTGKFVTHDAVHGAVAAVAAGSITIKATDGTSETFVVTGSTKVRVNGATGALGQVKVGDRVGVVGTGSAPMTATRVVDRGAPGTKHTGTKHTAKKHSGSAPTTPSGTGAATPTPTPTAPTS